LQKQKKEKSEVKILHHCNLICVSPKRGSWRCLKILYIHNCQNLFFCPRTIMKPR